MKNMLRLEEAAMLALSVYLFSYLPYASWVYWAWFLAPDAGMLGYLVSPRFGAFTYNLTHHKALAVLLYLGGYFLTIQELTLAGVVMFGHSSFDRLLG